MTDGVRAGIAFLDTSLLAFGAWGFGASLAS